MGCERDVRDEERGDEGGQADFEVSVSPDSLHPSFVDFDVSSLKRIQQEYLVVIQVSFIFRERERERE